MGDSWSAGITAAGGRRSGVKTMANTSKKLAMSRIEQALSQLDKVARNFDASSVKLTNFGSDFGSKRFLRFDFDTYPDFERWRRMTLAALEHIFGNGSRQVSEFKNIEFIGSATLSGNDSQEIKEAESALSSEIKEVESTLSSRFIEGLGQARFLLTSFLDEVREFWDDEMVSTPSSVAQLNETTAATPPSRDVFIVHGHDDGLKQAVARFLSKLKFNPIILHEQPEQGRTIIEKFHDYASVAYAIALFTPDDLAASAGMPDVLHPRARQNVVFELGFFIGRLGRTRACALVKQEVEMPSDFSGVVCIPVDNEGTWRFRLAKELKAAGFEIDGNLLL